MFVWEVSYNGLYTRVWIYIQHLHYSTVVDEGSVACIVWQWPNQLAPDVVGELVGTESPAASEGFPLFAALPLDI